jgi:hypothetical protein
MKLDGDNPDGYPLMHCAMWHSISSYLKEWKEWRILPSFSIPTPQDLRQKEN